MTGTQYFNRHEKDALVLTAPTRGPQQAAVVPGTLPVQPETDPREFPRLWAPDVGGSCTQQARVQEAADAELPPPVAVPWLPASPLWTLTWRRLVGNTAHADWRPYGSKLVLEYLGVVSPARNRFQLTPSILPATRTVMKVKRNWVLWPSCPPPSGRRQVRQLLPQQWTPRFGLERLEL